MVTKCDQVYGFAQWAQALTDEQSQEAMGYLSGTAADVAEKGGETGASDAGMSATANAID